MKVRELIEHLSKYNPDIPVKVVNLDAPTGGEDFEIIMCEANHDTEDDDVLYD